MSNIDKQWLQQKIADMQEHRDLFPADLDDDHGKVLAALRIALASLEAKPVAAAYVINGVIEADDFASYCGHPKFQDGPIELYANPPAPVSVPDAIEPTVEAIKRILPTSNPDDYAACIGADMWNACRAAMLQGAEPVTTAYKLRDALNAPDCWCHTCRPINLTDMRFVVCPECGNKRCPHANDHRNACTGSNEPGQEGSAYPAAPQQEVK